VKLVTGGAGFIGSHVVDALVARGAKVRVLDNLSTGRRAFLETHLRAKRIQLQRGDVLRPAADRLALRGVDEVWHLAADPDVRGGVRDPRSNYRDGTVATFEVLEAMRRTDARRLVFASSSTVYGEPSVLPTPEDYGPCLPISPYGASKLAAEAIVSAFVGTYGFQAWIFRFGNVVGPRLTHGVIYDFHKALKRDPKRLKILGDGRQEKSYLSTQDCVEGMLHAVDRATAPVNVYNLASESATTVTRIAQVVAEAHGLARVRYEYTGGDRGWAGDVRRMRLSVDRMAGLGWRPRHTSEEAVQLAAEWIAREG
jgi:UDP-glucose 4-epimerase